MESHLTGEIARPARLCRELLDALEATEGRRRRRKRDTTPDAIGIGIKRELLEDAVAEDPEPGDFEAWLVERCLAAGSGSGPYRAMALTILDEWKLAGMADSFRGWLDAGAPSDDKPDARSAASDGDRRLARACRNGACAVTAFLLLATYGCGGDDEGASARLVIEPGTPTGEVVDAMRGDPASTTYDAPPDLSLASAPAAPGAAVSPAADPARRGGLSADSLARVGGRPPPPPPAGSQPGAAAPAAAPANPPANPANPTAPPAARDTAAAPPRR